MELIKDTLEQIIPAPEGLMATINGENRPVMFLGLVKEVGAQKMHVSAFVLEYNEEEQGKGFIDVFKLSEYACLWVD